MSARKVLRELWVFRRTVLMIVVPLILMPIPLAIPRPEARCAYGILVMAVYWVAEVIPMAVTALFPLVLFPPLGVASAKQLAKNYLKDTNMLFLGGLMVAVGVERWNLHKRIALRVLTLVGSKPQWLMFGFMSTTAFLSMWISNTATTAMMVPIAQAVLEEIKGQKDTEQIPQVDEENELQGMNGTHSNEKTVDVNPDEGGNDIPEDPSKTEMPRSSKYSNICKCLVMCIPYAANVGGTATLPGSPPNMVMSGQVATTNKILKSAGVSEMTKPLENLSKMLLLCVPYAANIGGTATLTGTGPNLVVKGQVDSLYGSDAGINFSSWFIFAFPNMVLSLLLAWLWLQIFFLGPRALISCFQRSKGTEDQSANRIIRQEYEKLGKMTFAEASMLVMFGILALLWLSREPQFVPGWAVAFKKDYVTDASVAISICVVLFMLPSRRPTFLCCRQKGDMSPSGPVPALLDWETVHHKLPWSVVFVLGGGFALADACKTSGLSAWIGTKFEVLSQFPVWLMVLILCLMIATFTEVTSNVATATLFLPILAQLGEGIGVNPLALMIPATISCSFAFMLPVATPPNAIAFAYGHLRIVDMVKTGIFMNIVCIFLLTFTINTYGKAYFRLDVFPDWAGGPTTTVSNLNNTIVATVKSLLRNNTT